MKSLYYFIALSLFACSSQKESQNLNSLPIYHLPENVQSRWISFENLSGTKGAAAQENKGAKGHPYDWIEAGETKTVFDVKGSGMIHRMWFTIRDRSPEMLRSLKLEMYWDNAEKPAVSVPFGDFFSIGLGEKRSFENVFFSDPEGRSFNCKIPMPFRTAGKITITNESPKQLEMIFYDINYSLNLRHEQEVLYFHSYWSREQKTELGKDFELLPKILGKGRFLGVNIGVIENSVYKGSWWGEGEVKMYIDGDTDYPTLSGTGTEDYIGTGWGQGIYNHMNQGCLIAGEEGKWCFYRFHVPDPVFFYADCRVTIQQIGGSMRQKVLEMQQNNAPLIPVTINNSQDPSLMLLLDMEQPVDLSDTTTFPENWVNFYRSDDWSATSYFYLDQPSSNLPLLADVSIRTAEHKD